MRQPWRCTRCTLTYSCPARVQVLSQVPQASQVVTMGGPGSVAPVQVWDIPMTGKSSGVLHLESTDIYCVGNRRPVDTNEAAFASALKRAGRKGARAPVIRVSGVLLLASAALDR